MNIKEKIINSGHKLTKPRLAVLGCLKKQKGIISARDLHKKIKKIDQASVYRALNLFEKLNLVNVEILDKEKFYCLDDHPHHHIICRKCGYTEEFKCDKEKEFKYFKNFSNIRHQLTLSGVCKKCNK